MIFLFVILIIILGVYYIFTKPTREKENERKSTENDFVKDFTNILDKEAPNFKYIDISLSSNDDRIHITDKNGQQLIYSCEQHGFIVSRKARQRLVEELKSHYHTIVKPFYGTSYGYEDPPIESYRIIAHKGIEEENEKERQRNKGRKC